MNPSNPRTVMKKGTPIHKLMDYLLKLRKYFFVREKVRVNFKKINKLNVYLKIIEVKYFLRLKVAEAIIGHGS